MKLFIVESPGKVKKIQSMLGNGWTVESSAGHVRDLPAKEMGVVAPDFTPQYEPTERGAEVLRKLSELAAQADEIYLATDPDREGEAIAWHLADVLKLSSPKRITYTEITESAIKKAIGEFELRQALRAPASLILIETPTNPMMVRFDVAAVAEWAHGAGALLAVDNTFCTPHG